MKLGYTLVNKWQSYTKYQTSLVTNEWWDEQWEHWKDDEGVGMDDTSITNRDDFGGGDGGWHM
jgi:hypothetical protein